MAKAKKDKKAKGKGKKPKKANTPDFLKSCSEGDIVEVTFIKDIKSIIDNNGFFQEKPSQKFPLSALSAMLSGKTLSGLVTNKYIDYYPSDDCLNFLILEDEDGNDVRIHKPMVESWRHIGKRAQLNLDTLDHTMVFSRNSIDIDCQSISEEDGKIILAHLLGWFEIKLDGLEEAIGIKIPEFNYTNGEPYLEESE